MVDSNSELDTPDSILEQLDFILKENNRQVQVDKVDDEDKDDDKDKDEDEDKDEGIPQDIRQIGDNLLELISPEGENTDGKNNETPEQNGLTLSENERLKKENERLKEENKFIEFELNKAKKELTKKKESVINLAYSGLHLSKEFQKKEQCLEHQATFLRQAQSENNTLKIKNSKALKDNKDLQDKIKTLSKQLDESKLCNKNKSVEIQGLTSQIKEYKKIISSNEVKEAEIAMQKKNILHEKINQINQISANLGLKYQTFCYNIWYGLSFLWCGAQRIIDQKKSFVESVRRNIDKLEDKGTVESLLNMAKSNNGITKGWQSKCEALVCELQSLNNELF